MIKILNVAVKMELPVIMPLSISVPQVKGKQNDIGFNMTGNLSMGINRPHKNNIGNLKKFENVWASNTYLADTAINKPNKAEVTAIKITATSVSPQLISLKSIKNAAKTTGTNALTIPNKIAPRILAMTNALTLIGATNNLSNDRLLLSNVIVTARMEVVPNNTLIAIKPGSNSAIPISPCERISCIRVQESGNIIPQLILGGFKQ